MMRGYEVDEMVAKHCEEAPMSEVRRWDMDGDAQMFENGIGDYVLATDFDLEHQRRVEAERVMMSMANDCADAGWKGDTLKLYRAHLSRYKEVPDGTA